MEKERNGRRVFLSFLGTGNYRDGVYEENGKKSKNVRFVQNAIIELLNNEFDERYIFCTEGAQNTHLEALKKESGYEYKNIKIKEGRNEEEIWDIFQTIYDKLEENDEIVFDVTHSYRFLPMLGLLLLQHAKFLKGIKVKKLCYGAFEMAIDGVSPIMDFTSFSKLQDWSLAGNSFMKTGSVENFTDIAKEEFSATSANIDKNKQRMRKISGGLKDLAMDIYTVRGVNIVEANKIKEFREEIEGLKKELHPPFTLVIDKIEKNIEKFQEKKVQNVFCAVEWCIEKGLYQQGITMLQEGLITVLLDKVGLDYTSLEEREGFGDYIGYENIKGGKEFRGDTTKMEKIVKKLNEAGLDYNTLKQAYCNVKKLRNDINHGGFLIKDHKKGAKPSSKIDNKTFKKSLKDSYKKIKEIFEIE